VADLDGFGARARVAAGRRPDMRVLVAFASRYGSTRTLAEAMADRLRQLGHDAQAQGLTTISAADLDDYGALLIGSAAYMGHWLKEATEFVREHAVAIADRPTWLFSSGPLGKERTDALGRDLLVSAEPMEIAELQAEVRARGHRVFYGALDPDRLGLRDRAIRALPAARAGLPEGDFRDLREVDGWVDQIARQLPTEAVAETV
jgi:menaquinone-dependent protoporphyrinogen oxidase